jgi:hypothetical protein
LLRRYELFKGTEFIKKTKSSSYTFGVGELPEGNTTVSVRATDSEGADVRASVDIHVAPKPAEYNVEDEIFGMDVQQAVCSNDPGMLARIGTTLTTLTSMSHGVNRGGGGHGRRLVQDSSGAGAADSGLAEAVKIKVMQLLSALSSSATSSIMDAATVRQVRRIRLCCLGIVRSCRSCSVLVGKCPSVLLGVLFTETLCRSPARLIVF